MAKSFSVFVQIGGKVGSSFTSAIGTVEGRLKRLSNSYKAHAESAKASMSQIGQSMKGVAALAAAGGIAFGIKHAFGDAEELAHEMQGLRNAGRTAAEVAEGLQAANKAILDMPTASLAKSFRILNETTGAFGDYHHAVENLSFNSKLGDVLKNSLHVEDPGHELGSLIKALEIRGSAANPKTYRREAEELTRAMVFYGGRLKSDDIYTFASNAQVGIRQLSERFLTKIAPALIQELGGDKTGTGLTAFRTVISGSKISTMEQAKAWQQLGLLNSKEIRTNKKTGEIKGWRDGAITDTRLAYQDPLAFMEKDILPALQAHGTDINDPIKLGAKLRELFVNTKANAFVTAISTVVDRARLKKDEGLINKALTIDQNYDESLLNDPKMARYAISQAMQNIGSALALPLMKPMAQLLISIARSINKVSAALIAHPEAARIIAGIGAALSAMTAIRLASFVFGLSGMARALGFLVMAAPAGAALRIIAMSRAIKALAIASAAGVAGRLRAMAAGLLALNAVGGSRAVLAAIGGSLASMGMAVLRFPLTALRAVGAGLWGLAANPVGIAITAVVASLTALGVWVSNNWAGLKTFFEAFGPAFMKGLGPEAAGAVDKVAGGLKSAWDWASKLLGPIDETGQKWQSWGESAGTAAAKIVTGLAGLPGEIKAVAQKTWDALVNFDWVGAGSAIVAKIVQGVKSLATSLADSISGPIKSALDRLQFWKSAPAEAATQAKPSTPSLAGPRALGGPVARGSTYLVGERGPELFTPNASGSITSNLHLRQGAGLVDVTSVAEAGAVAARSGAILRASLNVTARPVVDTMSIDEATSKLGRLRAIMAGVGSDAITFGSAMGGVGGGTGGGTRGQGRLALMAGGSHDASGGQAYGARADLTAGAKESYEFWRSKGLSAAAAAGFVGSEQGENNFRANGTGDMGSAYGSMMWHGARRKQILQGMGLDVVGATHRQQLEAAYWEMTKGPDALAHRAWKLAQTAKTAGEAAAIHVNNFERPLDRVLNSRVRGAYANAWFKKFAGEEASAAEPPKAAPTIAPDPKVVGKLRAGAQGASSVRGDTHISNHWNITDANNPAAVQRQVDARFSDLLRQYESDQRGSLSD